MVKKMKVRISKKKSKKKLITISLLSLAFVLIALSLSFIGTDGNEVTGHFAYEIGEDVQNINTDLEKEKQAESYSWEDTSFFGHKVLYGPLVQGEVKLDKPVKWAQEVEVQNTGNEIMASAVIRLEVPDDASNIEIYLDGKKVSDNAFVKVPILNYGKNVVYMLTFETEAVHMEVIEEEINFRLFSKDLLDKDAWIRLLNGPLTKVRIWHDSSLHYYDIEIEMDISIGEKLLELSQGKEDIEFDYDKGEAKLRISKL
ncbi:MAG: hypothetical protein KKA65_04395 [Nanoarchaeota archaeon]|nr:hypothetical protein [Nanoarchaeota archaeon]MBU4242285.1 hypothetical protein [Nanoarchaeota archaeon]MBU4351962.1 hypothetical protein [Nanoarchaeota archaeon]MBU4456715.1 hypothetical protein [Nanoarchaeota archaeon]